MLNKLNFNERMLLKSIISISLMTIFLLVASVGFYLLDNTGNNWQNWILVVIILILIKELADFFITKWSVSILNKPLNEANEFTEKVFKNIESSNLKYEKVLNKQLDLIKEIKVMVDKLSYSSEDTKQCAQDVADKSNKALLMSEKGQESMKVNIRNMKTLKQKIETIAEQILELSEHTQQIGSIVGVVEDITEQTNMLALNAAVEAARAGEHGRGFAVVASEIRKLSDQCKQATTKITALIYDIQQATNSTVMATEEGTKEIEAGVNLASQVAEAINTLRITINDTVIAVEGIVMSSKQQFKFINEVSDVMNSINTSMEDTAETITQSRKITTMLNKVSDNLKYIFNTK